MCLLVAGGASAPIYSPVGHGRNVPGASHHVLSDLLTFANLASNNTYFSAAFVCVSLASAVLRPLGSLKTVCPFLENIVAFARFYDECFFILFVFPRHLVGKVDLACD